MKTLLKLLNRAEWISAAIALLFILLGLIQIPTGRLFGDTEIVNCFHAANSFLLLTIVLFLFIHFGKYKKE